MAKSKRQKSVGMTGTIASAPGVTITMDKDNTQQVLQLLTNAKVRITTLWGMKMESYAKRNTPVDTGNLRNSITFDANEERVVIGSAVQYAPHVELGVGAGFTPPPEWIEYEQYISKGKGGKSRAGKHMLRDAVQNHTDEYKRIMESELKK